MRAGLLLMLTGLAMWMGGIYLPSNLVPGITDEPLWRLGIVLSGMFVCFVGAGVERRELKAPAELPRGFDVKVSEDER
jgi:hypothetical protein